MGANAALEFKANLTAQAVDSFPRYMKTNRFAQLSRRSPPGGSLKLQGSCGRGARGEASCSTGGRRCGS
eukprot:2446460-Pyramimonas_sp.AAC.1